MIVTNKDIAWKPWKSFQNYQPPTHEVEVMNFKVGLSSCGHLAFGFKTTSSGLYAIIVYSNYCWKLSAEQNCQFSDSMQLVSREINSSATHHLVLVHTTKRNSTSKILRYLVVITAAETTLLWRLCNHVSNKPPKFVEINFSPKMSIYCSATTPCRSLEN